MAGGYRPTASPAPAPPRAWPASGAARTWLQPSNCVRSTVTVSAATALLVAKAPPVVTPHEGADQQRAAPDRGVRLGARLRVPLRAGRGAGRLVLPVRQGQRASAGGRAPGRGRP